MRRSFKNIYLYVSKEFLFSFIVAFLFFFVIFFINNILVLAEQILARHIPLPKVLELIFYSLPFIIAMSIPFGTLVGALMAIGRFSSDNEILAIQCCGIARKRAFIPLIFWGIILFILSFFVFDYLIPVGNINFSKLYREIIFTNPELELEPNTVKEYENRIIIPGDVIDRVIYDLVIMDKTDDNRQRVITAEEAHLLKSEENSGVISLEMTNVITQTPDPDKIGSFEYETAVSMIYNILLSDITSTIRNPGPQEMSSRLVWEGILEKRENLEAERTRHFKNLEQETYNLFTTYRLVSNQDDFSELSYESQDITQLFNDYTNLREKQDQVFFDRSLQLWEIEFYQKITIPLGCIVFVIMAFPLGLFSKRSGRSVGFGMGLFIAAFYWALILGARTLAIRSTYSPLMIMFLPDLIIFLIGVTFNILKRNK